METENGNLDSVVDQMVERTRRQGIYVDRAVLLNEMLHITSILDPIIAWGLDLATKMGIKDAGDKIFDTIIRKENAGEDDDRHAIGYLGIRFLDSMRYMTSIKKRFRGIPIESEFEPSIARAVLVKRGILKQ